MSNPDNPGGYPPNPEQGGSGGADPYSTPGYGQPAGGYTPSDPYGNTNPGPAYAPPPSQPVYAPPPSEPPYTRPPSQPAYAPPPSQPAYAPPPSQPPFAQPAPPSQPWAYPAAPSQPFAAPYSQPLYGQPPAPPKKSHKALWISLAIAVIVLLLAGSAGAFAVSQYAAPGAAAKEFCTDLTTQNYDSAYALLSSGMRGQLSQTQFRQDAEQLDAAEGKVTSCGQASGANTYSYTLFSSTATVSAAMGREKQGSLTGVVHLKNEGGSWKVDSLDTGLLGANLASLQALQTFCSDLQGQSYTAAYALLGSAVQGIVSQTDFSTASAFHDQIDGPVTACGLASVASGNTDTATSLTATVTRGKLGQRTGTVSLDIEGGQWKISTLDPTLQGTDIGPLQVGSAMCTAATNGNIAAAWSLLSGTAQQNVSVQQLTAFFQLPSGVKYVGCKPDLTTYKVTGSSASYTAIVTVQSTATGNTADVHLDIRFVQEGLIWKVDYMAFR